MADPQKKASPARPAVGLIDLRSTYNVGNIARTALAFGFDRLYTVGTTPELSRKETLKAALGGEQICHTHLNSFTSLVEVVKNKYEIIALETGGEDIKEFNFTQITRPILLLLGNERFGLSQKQLQYCNYCLSIKHREQIIKSLNVGNAFAIAASILGG